MNPFKSLSIRARLAGSFGLLIAIVVALAGGAIVGLQRFDDSVHEVVDDKFAKIRLVGELTDNVSVVVLAVRNFVLATDPEAQKLELTTIQDTRAAIDADYKNLEAAVTDDDTRAKLKATEGRGEGFLKAVDAFIAAASAGNVDAAKALVVGDLQKGQLDYLAALASLSRQQEKGMDRAVESAVQLGELLKLVMVGGAAVGVLFGIVTALFTTRAVTRPIGEAVAALNELASGNLAVDVRTSRRDEFGQMLAALGQTVTSLRGVVGRVNEGVLQVTTASSQIAAGNQDLSSRTEQQASSLQQTAASMEEFNGSIRQSADHARQASQLAAAASDAAGHGGEVVSQVVATMNDISASSHKIADIIGVIDGIAFQTNILALNAAVEAARAGEQGRGFAVVASEVRSLAKRSGDAAREIKALITNSVERVEVGSRQVGEAGSAMTTIVTQVKKVTDLIGEISTAAVEQSSGIGQVSEAVAQMDRVTQQNASLVEEAAAAAQSLNQQAVQLSEAVSAFRLQAA